MKNKILLSVVSHGQGEIVNDLMADIAKYSSDSEVILTCNIPESDDIKVNGLKQFQCITNSEKKGFGENHNSAFARCNQTFFCVINPDVRLIDDPFNQLIDCMKDPLVGVVVPKVINPNGILEDSARYFPTFVRLIAKALKWSDGRFPISSQSPSEVDWAAGIFMLFRAEAFREIGGFDKDFFLYYEDVDICARLWKTGWKVVYQPHAVIVHDAQRASRVSWQYRKWHFMSMARYFFKHWGRLPKIPLSN